MRCQREALPSGTWCGVCLGYDLDNAAGALRASEIDDDELTAEGAPFADHEYFGMYTDDANRIVAAAFEKVAAEGGRRTGSEIIRAVTSEAKVQAAAAGVDVSEIDDTAVREAMWAAMESDMDVFDQETIFQTRGWVPPVDPVTVSRAELRGLLDQLDNLQSAEFALGGDRQIRLKLAEMCGISAADYSSGRY